MFQRKLIFFFCLLMLAGCASKKKQFPKINAKSAELEETIARMTYVPDIPFGFYLHSLIPDQINPENLQVVYHAKKSITIDPQYLKKTYQAEMETLGWDLVSSFESEHELLMLFVRPLNIWCQIRFVDQKILTLVIMQEKKDRL